MVTLRDSKTYKEVVTILDDLEDSEIKETSPSEFAEKHGFLWEYRYWEWAQLPEGKEYTNEILTNEDEYQKILEASKKNKTYILLAILIEAYKRCIADIFETYKYYNMEEDNEYF